MEGKKATWKWLVALATHNLKIRGLTYIKKRNDMSKHMSISLLKKKSHESKQKTY